MGAADVSVDMVQVSERLALRRVVHHYAGGDVVGYEVQGEQCSDSGRVMLWTRVEMDVEEARRVAGFLRMWVG